MVSHMFNVLLYKYFGFTQYYKYIISKMENKELKNACYSIAEKIEALKKEDNYIVTDGIVDIESYVNATPKILWVLKEANSAGEDWSYSDFYKCTWHNHNGISSIRKTVYTTYGLLNNINDFSDIPVWSKESYQEELKKMAIINIKKVPGGARSCYHEIKAAYEENEELLKEQIDVYNPDVIIFGGTFKFMEFLHQNLPNKTITEINNHYYNVDGRLLINTYHPSYIRFTDEAYVMDIVNIVKANLK